MDSEIVELDIKVVTVVYLESRPLERPSKSFEQAVKAKCLVISQRVVK